MTDDEDGGYSGAAWPASLSGMWGAAPGDAPAGSHPFAIEQHERYPEGVLLGAGGMGRVTAVQDARLGRQVALKRLAQPRLDDEARTRLAQEAWITAHLEHPGIVPVYDAGLDAQGQLFYTMRLLRGRSLAASIAERPTLSDRLALLRALRDACEAVGYAHAQGVVHRDLKPENIMLGSFGETQVVDWGLAGVADGAERPATAMVPAGHAAQTVLGAVVGTPAYLAPEVALGRPATPRSDVYGLGATLLELLAGRHPFHPLDGAEVLQRLRAGERPDPDALAPDVPPALLAVARRALHADPGRRYPDAKAMADEITAWMDGRRVEAHAYTPRELWQRFAAAHRVPLTVGAVALVLLLTVGLVAYLRTAGERDRAKAAQAAAVAERERADRHLAHALLEKAHAAARVDARAETEVLAAHALRLLGESPAARGLLARFAAAPRPRRLYAAPRPHCPTPVISEDGGRLLCVGDDGVALYDLPRATLRWRIDAAAQAGAFVGDDAVLLRDLARHTLHDAGTGHLRRVVEGPVEWGTILVGGPSALSVLTDAVTTVTADGATRRHPADPGGRLCEGDRVRLATWSPDGTWLAHCEAGATYAIGPDGSSRLVTRLPTQGSPIWADPPRVFPVRPAEWATISRIAVLPGGHEAVLGTWKGGVFTLDLQTGDIGHTGVAAGGPVRDLAVSPDGRLALVTTERGGPGLFDLRAGAWVGRLPADARGPARFAGADTVLTVGPKRISVWRLPAELPALALYTHTGQASVAWSADGAWLASGQAAGWVSVWHLPDGAQRARHRLGDFVVRAVDFTPEAPALITYGGGDADLARLEAPDWTPTYARRPLIYGRYLGILRGSWLLRAELRTATWARTADAFGEAPLPTWRPDEPSEVVALGVSPDRERAVIAFHDGRLLGATADALPDGAAVLGDLRGVVDLEVGDDGALLVHRNSRLETYRQLPGPPAHAFLVEPRPEDIAWSPDQRWIAAGLLDGTLRLYDARDGRLTAEAQLHRERISALAFSPDGRRLASASWDKSLRLWSLDALEPTPAALMADIEAAWDLSLDDVLTARID